MSVDWSKVAEGAHGATVTIEATVKGKVMNSVPVEVTANKTVVLEGFTGEFLCGSCDLRWWLTQ